MIPFVHIQAKGSYRELGRAVGEGAREQIHASVAFFRDGFRAMTSGRLDFEEAERQVAPYAVQARRWLPRHLEELEGVAEGSKLPLRHLMVLNCLEEFTADEARESCTAVAGASAGRHVVGHNMDWYVVDAPNNVMFDLTVPDGTRLMGIAGAPYLLMLAMTSHGIGNVSNSVHNNDTRVGVPNAFVRRSSLEGATLEEARDRGRLAARARGTNHFLADTGGRLWDIETAAIADAFTDHSADGFMAHTNHYVAADMAPYEAFVREESAVRLGTAERILRDGVVRGDDPVDLVARVLRCHDPSPDRSICGHPETDLPVAEQGMTVGSMICDLDQRRMYVCAGAPCQNAYEIYEM
jgi:isopenicillin-N N-acyltransferase-like protein